MRMGQGFVLGANARQVRDDARRLAHAAEQAAAVQYRVGAWLDVHVRRGRSSGMSWAEVGSEIGVSRQAAQQRFGSDDALVARLNRGPIGLKTLEKTAHRTGHSYLGTEHVLLAILRSAPDVLAPHLADADVSASLLRLEVRNRVGVSEPGPVGALTISQRLRRSLFRSSERSAECGRYELTPEDLIYGMLDDPDAVAVEAMRAVGLDISRLQLSLEEQSRPAAVVPFDTFRVPQSGP